MERERAERERLEKQGAELAQSASTKQQEAEQLAARLKELEKATADAKRQTEESAELVAEEVANKMKAVADAAAARRPGAVDRQLFLAVAAVALPLRHDTSTLRSTGSAARPGPSSREGGHMAPNL